MIRPSDPRPFRTGILGKQLRMWGPAATWAAVLFLLSAWPNPRVSLWLALNDKVVHLGLYAVFGAALGVGRIWSAAQPPPHHLVFILVGCLYGVSDEWHQSFVPGRFPSLSDWLADFTGVLLGYCLYLIFAGVIFGRARSRAETRVT